MHGWKEAIEMAVASDCTRCDQLSADAEERWHHESAKRARRANKKPTYPHKVAAIDLARINIVRWLFSNRTDSAGQNGGDRKAESIAPRLPSSPPRINSPDTPLLPNTQEFDDLLLPASDNTELTEAEYTLVGQIQKIGNSLFDDVLNDIEKEYNGQIPDVVKHALADHFWCDLLAHLAHVISESITAIDGVPGRIVNLIMASRREDSRLPLERFVVKIAVNSLWKSICHLTTSGLIGRGRAMLPILRILAILICKSPERHKAVVIYCIDPLEDQLLTITKQKLLEVFREWLPRIKKSLSSDTGR